MSYRNKIQVLLYWGGSLLQNTESVEYDRGPSGITTIPRSIQFGELLSKLYEITGIDSNQHLLKLYAKYLFSDITGVKQTRVPINGDQNLGFFLDPGNEINCLELYIETEQIQPIIVQEMPRNINRGPYMSLLTENALPNLPIFTEGLTNECIHESFPHTSTSCQETQRDWQHNMEYNSGREPYDAHTEAVTRDPQADSFGHFGHDIQSEADEISSEDEDDNDEVDINVMSETFADRGEGILSQLQVHTNAQMPSTVGKRALYPSIPFFSMTHAEQLADSINIPTGKWGRFYDYSKGEIHLHMVFKDKLHLQAAVKDYSVRIVKREYRVIQSTPKLWRVVCKHSTGDYPCGWYLRAIWKEKIRLFKITRYGGPHTCLLSNLSINHANLDKNMIASALVGIVKSDPAYKIKHVMQTIKDKYDFDISYIKAWYGLRRAIENVYGTWENSVRKLPKYMGALQKSNPGTIVEWNHHDTERPRKKMLNYVFWAFQPCIEGFQHCRKIISVDGTHLYTKYKHKMLMAVGLDANDQILPLAFAIVDDETFMSWKWFLEMVAKYIVKGVEGICLISDRHRAILGAVECIPDFMPPRGVHRFCLRHVCSNFNNMFKNVHLKDLCWKAGAENQVRKFDSTMEEIKSIEPRAFNYLSRIDKSQWTLAHDGGYRCGILTTNISECLNGVMKGARRLPIMAIVQMTFDRCVEYFLERLENGNNMVQRRQEWSDSVFEKFARWDHHSIRHNVQIFDRREYTASVVTRQRVGRGNNTHVVKLKSSECSCGKWSQFGIPCSHAIQVCRTYGLNAKTLVKPCYSMKAYFETYQGRFEPVMHEDYWDSPCFELVHNPSLKKTKRAGRDQTRRIENEMDWPQARARQQMASSQHQ